MESPPASANVCSVCGEPLNVKGGCVACLLRAGLDEVPREGTSPPDSLSFGDYEIARRADGSLWELGRGAMGVTYRAVDKVLHRNVALKVIETPSGGDGSQAVRERFLREARAAAALRHPNVAGVFHLSASPDVERCYFAMELVEGETLEARVRRDGPLKVEVALEIAVQITRALMAAAARGLIHRDLKPGNIMLTRGEGGSSELEVKVIDFGLAKAAAEAAGEMDLTHGGFVGTPAFASPEQFESGTVDARSDIYALGATLWFTLTGRAPFSATTVEEMRVSRTRTPLPVEQLIAKKVPPAVITLVRSCLAVDPSERPGSARELMESLEFCRSRLSESGRSGSGTFFQQLKQRNVVRVAIAYGVTAWLLAQIATQIFPFFDVPTWGVRLVILVLCLGFPVALMLAWAFQLTPEGEARREGTPNGLGTRSAGYKFTALVALVALAAAVLFALRLAREKTSAPAVSKLAPAVSTEKSIAVLPLENLSDDKENSFFADGLQDDILTSVAKISELKVISRTSVSQYRGAGALRNLREVARELGVESILVGSVRRVGNRVLVNVQLIDALTDRHIWAERYDRTLTNSIGLQSEVATEIATALRAKLAPEEKARLEAKPTDNPEAYALYLKARGREGAVNRSHEDIMAAEQLYEEAIVLDPKFALAHARLSIVQSQLLLTTYDDDWKSKARSAAEEAFRLAPSLGEAHMARGLSLYWGDKDYAAALKEFTKAAATSPNELDVLYYIAGIYRRQGRWRESVATLQRAIDLDPRDRKIVALAANNYLFVRNWPAATACFNRELELAPDSARAQVSLAYLEVFRNGNVAAARKILDRISPGVDPDGIVTESRWDLAMLGRDYAAAEKMLTDFPLEEFPGAGGIPKTFFQGRVAFARGDLESARRYLAEAKAVVEGWVRESPGKPDFRTVLASIYVYLGQKDDAIREARKAVELEPESQNALHGAIQVASLALIYAGAGEVDQAIPLIERLISTPGPVGLGNESFTITQADLRLRWEWDSLRSNPRFQKILAEPEPKTVY